MTALGQDAGQTSAGKSEAARAAKQKIYEIARAKRQNMPFTLITPQDLAALSPDERNALTGPQDPCDTAFQIDFGQTINGQLTTADCQLEDNSYADFYFFNGTSGQQVTVALNSSDFDAYLGLANEDDSLHIEDDDSGGGSNARIVATLPSTGVYVILANAYDPFDTGNYSLSLTGSSACTYSLSPTSADVPAAGGNFSLALTTQAGCSWSTVYYGGYSYITVNNPTGTGSATINYSVAPNTDLYARSGYFTINGQRFTVNQAPKVCSFTLSPASVSVPATGGSGSFTVSTTEGCTWTTTSNNRDFIDFGPLGDRTGSGTVNYSVQADSGANRTATINITGVLNSAVFTINQTGLNCSYTASQNNLTFDRLEHTGTIYVTTQPGCTWRVSSANWVTIDLTEKTGSGSFIYKISANTGAPRSQQLAYQGAGGSYLIFNFKQTAVIFSSRPDFDADGKADLAVFRPSNGYWYLPQISGGFNGVELGGAADKLVPADYDGDGKTDVAIYNGGNWTIQRSSDGQLANVGFGAAEDIPVPADFDGDGKADISVYRPSNGVWYRLNSTNGNFVANGWGAAEDKPVIGDFDGDGKADLCVYRPSNGVWYLIKSSNNEFVATGFGAAEDLIVPADYDGDGKTDIAVYRPSNNVWYRLNSTDGSFYAVGWGSGTDKPVPADYDGDGKADVAVYRDGTWYIVRSSDAQISFGYFGAAGDVPLANAYVK